jgi:hypothetical protein
LHSGSKGGQQFLNAISARTAVGSEFVGQGFDSSSCMNTTCAREAAVPLSELVEQFVQQDSGDRSIDRVAPAKHRDKNHEITRFLGQNMSSKKCLTGARPSCIFWVDPQ